MSERRQHPRVSSSLEIEMRYTIEGKAKIKAMDVSDSGMFVFTNGGPIPPVGSVVSVTLPDPEDDGLSSIVDMKVVRYEGEGVGLEFVEGA